MDWRFSTLTLALAFGISGTNPWALPQTPAPVQTPATSVQPRDLALEGAEALIGRALFLRGFYAGGELAYDALGKVKGEPKKLDWTLAGADISKVVRRGEDVGAGELELDGLRVAIRYNPDQHVFERHPQKDQKLRILLAVNDGARGLQGALAAIFAVGIDPTLQRSMPTYWQHYFFPGLVWPGDDLTGQTIIPANAAPGGGITFPVLEKKQEPELTNEARQDHVKGLVQVRITVGTDGVPRRTSIRQPLGYGLDARVAETVAKYRFHPGTKDGNPVAVEMLVNQTFDYSPPR